jgi:hypothetical protein
VERVVDFEVQLHEVVVQLPHVSVREAVDVVLKLMRSVRGRRWRAPCTRGSWK